nr:hypothetical protein [uncultured Sphingorhabdus sp.]
MKNETDGRDDHGENGPEQWKGLAEIDQAIQQNRLTEYRVKKAWADPWNRIALLGLIAAIVAFIIYAVVDELYF